MDALALLRQHEPVIKKQSGGAAIGIFGAFIRGKEQPDSDVDVLVTFQKGAEDVRQLHGCRFYPEDLFMRNVDPVMKGTIRKRLKPSILGDVVYAQEW